MSNKKVLFPFLEQLIDKGSIAVLRYVLEHKDDYELDIRVGYSYKLSKRSSKRFEPLILTAYNKERLDIVTILLEYKADANHLIHPAAYKGDRDTVKNMITNYQANPSDALWSFVEKNDKEMVAWLLEQGADPNKGIGAAASCKNEVLLEMFLANKDRLDQRTLSEALLGTNTACFKKLIDEGADIYFRNHQVLFNAVRNDDIDMLNALLDEDKKKSQQYDTLLQSDEQGYGESVLLCAVENNAYNCVNRLLQNKANPNQKDSYRDPPITQAKGKLIPLFIKYQADIYVNNNEVLANMIRTNDIDGLKALIAHDRSGKNEYTPELLSDQLKKYIHSVSNEMLSILLEKGVDINKQHNYQELISSYEPGCCRKRDPIKKYEDVRRTILMQSLIPPLGQLRSRTDFRSFHNNYSRKIPFPFVFENNEDQIGNIKLLLKHGADPTIKDSNGYDAFSLTDSVQVQRLMQNQLQENQRRMQLTKTPQPLASEKNKEAKKQNSCCVIS